MSLQNKDSQARLNDKNFFLELLFKTPVVDLLFLIHHNLSGCFRICPRKGFFVNNWQLVVKDFSAQFQINPLLKLNETGKSVM